MAAKGARRGEVGGRGRDGGKAVTSLGDNIKEDGTARRGEVGGFFNM
jgi:hypothetical protein